MTLYLDTSSLVKLYVDEPDADDVQRVVGEADVVATRSWHMPRPAPRLRAGGGRS